MNPKVQDACQTLGFAQLVPLEQIKTAYRKLVIQHHPDKGGNPETFKKIQEAYEYLTTQAQAQAQSQVHQPVQGKCSDIHLELQMTLVEFYTGKNCQTIITSDKICPSCQGLGYQKQHSQNTECTFCTSSSIAPPNCNFCLGTGIMMTEQNMCQECKGIKVIKSREHLNLNLPPGLNNGEQLTILNAGNEYPNKKRGTVYLKIRETNPPLPAHYPPYTRRGNDLYLTQRINLTDALAGHQFQLKLLDDSTINIQTMSVIIPGQTKTIPGYGMPVRNRPHRRGNLIIKFEVFFPPKLITAPKTELQTILQQPGSIIQTPSPPNLVRI